MLMVIQSVSKEINCFLLLLKSCKNGVIDFLRQGDDLPNFLTLLAKGGGGGGGGGGGVIQYELQICSFTSTKLPRYVTVTIIIRMCR